MSKDTNLNLPDGILQQYQRRYSDPTPSRVFHKPPRPRRFSLTTFDDLKDISSRSVRSCVNKVLHSSGFTQHDQAKTSQMRRYSMYVDTQVENNLGGKGQRRTSFSEKLENPSDDNTLFRKRAHSDLSRKKSSITYWNDKDLEEYQNHLSKIKPSPYNVCDDQYWLSRCSKNIDQTDTSVKIPKCNYKLRENGLVSSEMSSAYGVQIQCADRSCSRNSTQSLARTTFNDNAISDHELRPSSNLSCHTIKKSSSLKCRPGSSLSSHTRESTIDFKRPTTSLHWDLEDDENFKYSFYNPAGKDDAFLSTVPHVPCTPRKSDLKTTSGTGLSDTRPRRLSGINFEIIGNPSLHGSPMYSGRLKLCSYRSYY